MRLQNSISVLKDDTFDNQAPFPQVMPITENNESLIIDFANVKAVDHSNSQSDLNLSQKIYNLSQNTNLVQMGVMGSKNVKIN